MTNEPLEKKMRINARLRLNIPLSLAMTLPGLASTAIAAPPTDKQLVEEVDALVSKTLQEPGGVGLSIAIARGGKIILARGYGLAEVEHDVSANAETTFRIGSLTKQFTAAALMRLIEQDKISLDDELSAYLPDFPTQSHTVTIRHLLTHTSGIKSYTGVDEFWQTGATRELSPEELLAYVKDKKFDFEPGSKFLYNNTAYYMLGPIIESVSGMSYCEFLQSEFFGPLGLDRTRCDSNTELIANRAQGYRLVEEQLANDGLMGMANPGAAGMLLSSAQDLVKWSMALMNHKVVSADSLTLMTTPTVLPDGESTGYGFGLMMGDLDGHCRISHGGGIFGFNSSLAYFPDDDLYVAVISNSESASSSRLGNDIVRAALGIKDEVADLLVSPEIMRQFSGTYILEQFQLEAQIFEKDGQLFLQATGQPELRLLYQGKGEFRAQIDTSIKVVFEMRGDSDRSPTFTLHQSGMKVKANRKP